MGLVGIWRYPSPSRQPDHTHPNQVHNSALLKTTMNSRFRLGIDLETHCFNYNYGVTVNSKIALGHRLGFKQTWPRPLKPILQFCPTYKMYSWIAYFEMSGLLYDSGVLTDWAERTSRVDIDPSFPERITKGSVIDTDYLGDAALDMTDWLNCEHPNVTPYLRLDNLQNESGTWIELDGHLAQDDKDRGRSIFCFIRSFMAAKKDAESLINHLSQKYVGGAGYRTSLQSLSHLLEKFLGARHFLRMTNAD